MAQFCSFCKISNLAAKVAKQSPWKTTLELEKRELSQNSTTTRPLTNPAVMMTAADGMEAREASAQSSGSTDGRTLIPPPTRFCYRHCGTGVSQLVPSERKFEPALRQPASYAMHPLFYPRKEKDKTYQRHLRLIARNR